MEKGEDFTNEEFMLGLREGVKLTANGYLSSWNFIYSRDALPKGRLIVHYLQEHEEQIEFIKSRMENKFFCKSLDTPRYTTFILDPIYVQEREFRRDYANAIFFDEEMNRVDIEEIVRNPNNKRVMRRERDLVLDLSQIVDIKEVLIYLKESDEQGPEPWIDAAMIVLPEDTNIEVPIFVPKRFFSISREHSEFYSVVYDDERRIALEAQLDRFKNLKNESRMVASLINQELNEYMARNLLPLRRL